MEEYEFGVLEDRIISLCEAARPDYEAICRQIEGGANVNAVNKYGQAFLSKILLSLEHGNKFTDIVKTVLLSGFDSEKLGLRCIESILFTTYDKYIFSTAKLLLEVGATGTDEQWGSLLKAIGTEESYQRCCEGNHKCENIYYPLYEIVAHARKGLPYLFPGAKILDIGAGAGEYSLYFARQGYSVSALELADSNLAAFREKLTGSDPIDLVQGNALDLSRYADDAFDIVLLFGPLYHLHDETDKRRCIEQAKRVCKPEGKIFFAFIANDIVILTMFACHPDYFTEGAYNKETFKLDDFPFVFHTVAQCRDLLRGCGIRILHEVASDGVSELMQEKINAMDDVSFAQYLRFHDYICEKPECLGMSNHLLFVGKPGK